MSSPVNAGKSEAPPAKHDDGWASDLACPCGMITWAKRPSGNVVCKNCGRPYPQSEENARPKLP